MNIKGNLGAGKHPECNPMRGRWQGVRQSHLRSPDEERMGHSLQALCLLGSSELFCFGSCWESHFSLLHLPGEQIITPQS